MYHWFEYWRGLPQPHLQAERAAKLAHHPMTFEPPGWTLMYGGVSDEVVRDMFGAHRAPRVVDGRQVDRRRNGRVRLRRRGT